jgi:hypothetical protein
MQDLVVFRVLSGLSGLIGSLTPRRRTHREKKAVPDRGISSLHSRCLEWARKSLNPCKELQRHCLVWTLKYVPRALEQTKFVVAGQLTVVAHTFATHISVQAALFCYFID